MLQAALAPVSALYGAVASWRADNARPAAVGADIICVGNVTMGGAGKTPVTRALRARLPHAHVLLRGYGGRMKGPLRVTPDMDAADVGDEALLHAQDGPTWVAARRADGARAAVAAGARLILMDDGHQNHSLKKALSIVVVDAESGFGNERVFPSGPLRETLRAGLSRADAFVLMGQGEAPAEVRALGRPLLRAHIAPRASAPSGPLVAFAGIARPEKFFATLQSLDADLRETAPFSDHHRYEAGDLSFLRALARERGARLITTEKDHVRLPAHERTDILCLPVRAQFDDEAALDSLLAPFKEKEPA